MNKKRIERTEEEERNDQEREKTKRIAKIVRKLLA